MRRIQICADDYGFDDGISQAILDLIDAGRLSASSCMVLSPAWVRWAPALRERTARADVGLHLDVNEFAPYAPGRSLSGWIVAAYTGQLRFAECKAWVDAQLDAFEAQMGRGPTYVDGHQHVHQLPVLRDALMVALRERYGWACAVRITRSRPWRGLKASIIGGLGSAALQAAAYRAAIRFNTDFAGVYPFDDSVPYEQRVNRWLDSLPDGGLLMTHPGRMEGLGERPDPIRAARQRELDFWRSEAAGQLLAQQGIVLGRCEDWR